MNYGNYYPDQRHVLQLTTIRRERVFPEGAIGRLEAHEGERLDLRDIVARGTLPASYRLLEAQSFFKLNKPEKLDPLWRVEVGEEVEDGTILAGKVNGRGRKLLSPVQGVVAYIGEGRIIIQESPEEVFLEAGLVGTVVSVREERGVVIEAAGAVLQGVWGNGRRQLGLLRSEPNTGFENLSATQLDIEYRGTIMLTKRPLMPQSFRAVEALGLIGLVAPSMSPTLVSLAQASPAAVLLTEGFGDTKMSGFIYNFLETFNTRQVTLDAVTPDLMETRRPEIIVNVPTRPNERPASPENDLALEPGVNVRLTRGNNAGAVGQVTELPKAPVLLENGLRVMCSTVNLITGENVTVPLANLEVFGQ
jgi:hypothetical protein